MAYFLINCSADIIHLQPPEVIMRQTYLPQASIILINTTHFKKEAYFNKPTL
jgi:hypothetical protein